MLLLFSIRVLNNHMFGKELFVMFALCFVRDRLSISVYVCFFPLLGLRVECGL